MPKESEADVQQLADRLAIVQTRPRALASAASQRRVCRSSIVGISKANFCAISVTREPSINVTTQRLPNSPFPSCFHAIGFHYFRTPA